MAGEIIDSIINMIKVGENFLLSGGAGCGKTHSLMEVLNYIHSEYPLANIACITYTNVAVDEIKERAPYKNIKASTIHDFLWETIQNYQKDIKISLIELLQSEIEEKNSGIKYSGEKTIDENFFNSIEKIKYKDYRKIEEGIISHNDVLKLANHMYKKYDLLCEILIDKYKFILIDEYQDAEQQVIEIFLDFLPRITHKSNIIGFFGDAMQSIYDTGIGNLNKYIEEKKVSEIKKADNWRCSVEVINLINKIRTDGIIQKPKGENAERIGSIKFLYSNDILNIDEIKTKEYFNDWNFSNPQETKELYLTHNLIADKAGFGAIYNIYSKDAIIKQVIKIKKELKKQNGFDEIKELTFGEVLEKKIVNEAPNFKRFIEENELLFEYAKELSFDELSKVHLDKEKLVGDNKDFLIKHLYKIQDLVFYYEQNDINNFIRNSNYKISSVEDKIKLKDLINDINDFKNKTISEVIDFADENKLIIKDDLIKQFINENNYLFHRLKDIKFEQIINLYRFEQDFTPYSTQHGIKGAEFVNVFVILDNGKWNKYNFKYLFEENGNENVIERTRKMFYVSCSRAKDNLIVYYNNPSNEVLNKAKDWFKEENVIKIE